MPVASPHIRWRDLEGGVVILDLRRGSYLALDRVGSVIWRGIARGCSAAALADALCGHYETTPDDARREVDHFVDRCAHDGLLCAPHSREAPPLSERATPHTSKFPLVSAWWSLFHTSRGLTTEGFGSVYARMSALAKPKGDSATAGRVEATVRVFLRAENLFWSRRAPADCLMRSLALYRFLLSRGIAARHRIGVRQGPFLAHAWVECDDRPLLEDEGLTSGFTAIAEL